MHALSFSGKLQDCFESSTQVGSGVDHQLPLLKKKHSGRVGRPAHDEPWGDIVHHVAVDTVRWLFT